VKTKTITFVIAGIAVMAVATVILREPSLPKIPQSRRCMVMGERRDLGEIRIPPRATKDEVRRVLGDPQNTDVDGEVWLWLTDWESYERSGLSRDWLTMSQHSGGHDGLWIGFDEHGRVRTPLWSLSAATPPARDQDR
jgi:hypothetical protein